MYRTPISVSEIQVEDLPEVRVGGSFKRTFSTTAGDVSKNFFRVWEGESQGYTLSVQSGTKKQWIDSILNAKKAACAKKITSVRAVPVVPCLELNGAESSNDNVTTPNDDDETVPVSPTVPASPTVPESPPLEFITPQAKQPRSRACVDYTPTASGGKKLREPHDNQICTTPTVRHLASASRISNPETPTRSPSCDTENCMNAVNQMTPFSATSPKLLLRTDEHVLRLVVDEASPTNSSLTKTSTV